MMDPMLNVSYATIASFFEAAGGSYRNAIYVSCPCGCNRESGCGDFLFIPGHDCRPILLPVTDMENFIGKAVDRTECACTISSQCFIRLYNKWLELATTSAKDCPIQQLLHRMGSDNPKCCLSARRKT